MSKRRKIAIFTVVAILYSGIVLQIGFAVAATIPEPGSDADPIVTKSYVDSAVAGINTKLTQFTDSIKNLTLAVTDLTASQNSQKTDISSINEKLASVSENAKQLTTNIDTINSKVQELADNINSLQKSTSVPASGSSPTPNTTKPSITASPSNSTSQLQADAFKFKTITVKAGKKLIGSASTEIILRIGKATAIGSKTYGIIDIMNGSELKTGSEVKINHLVLIPIDDNRGITAKTNCTLLVRGDYKIK